MFNKIVNVLESEVYSFRVALGSYIDIFVVKKHNILWPLHLFKLSIFFPYWSAREILVKSFEVSIYENLIKYMYKSRIFILIQEYYLASRKFFFMYKKMYFYNRTEFLLGPEELSQEHYIISALDEARLSNWTCSQWITPARDNLGLPHILCANK